MHNPANIEKFNMSGMFPFLKIELIPFSKITLNDFDIFFPFKNKELIFVLIMNVVFYLLQANIPFA
jgi:hypothetical protein